MKALFCLLVLVQSVFLMPFASLAADKATEEGQKLAAEVRNQRPEKDLESSGTLLIRNSDGNSKEVPIRFNIHASDDFWISSYEIVDSKGKMLDRLTITHFNSKTNQYLFENGLSNSSGINSIGSKKILSVEETFKPFGNSDFWICDLGMEFFQWPTQRLVKKEMRMSRSCLVLESKPLLSVTNGYTRVLSWVDYETHRLIRAEAYGSNNQIIKAFAVGEIKKIDGKYQVKELDIRYIPGNSRTRLEFDLKVREE